jgi:hypothetical protein
MEFERLYKFIIGFNEHVKMIKPEEDYELFETWELDMAKAFLHDCPEAAIRIAKIILAVKDINDVKVKIN